MKKFGILMFVVALLLNYGHVAPLNAQSDDPRLKVPHISAEAALMMYRSGKLLLIDVHPGGKSKTRSMIVGALYIPADKLTGLNQKIPQSRPIALFCD